MLHFDGKSSRLEIRLEFDHYKQLEILIDDYCAVNKRQEDLEKIEHFLCLQNYMPVIHLDFYLSNNPINLLENFFKKTI